MTETEIKTPPVDREVRKGIEVLWTNKSLHLKDIEVLQIDLNLDLKGRKAQLLDPKLHPVDIEVHQIGARLLEIETKVLINAGLPIEIYQINMIGTENLQVNEIEIKEIPQTGIEIKEIPQTGKIKEVPQTSKIKEVPQTGRSLMMAEGTKNIWRRWKERDLTKRPENLYGRSLQIETEASRREVQKITKRDRTTRRGHTERRNENLLAMRMNTEERL